MIIHEKVISMIQIKFRISFANMLVPFKLYFLRGTYLYNFNNMYYHKMMTKNWNHWLYMYVLDYF